MKVVCVNAQNKPTGIKDKNWLKEGKEYTVVEILKASNIVGEYTFKLEEVKPDKPYGGYASSRFVPFEVYYDKESDEAVDTLLQELGLYTETKRDWQKKEELVEV